jgi:four helix bundle protein
LFGYLAIRGVPTFRSMLFKDLKAYQHARRLSVLSRPLIKRLPASESDLADQWRRACNSVALNLAEGISRRGSREFRRFADMSRGSLVEVEAIIDLVEHLGHFRADELEEVKGTRDECAKTVYGVCCVSCLLHSAFFSAVYG